MVLPKAQPEKFAIQQDSQVGAGMGKAFTTHGTEAPWESHICRGPTSRAATHTLRMAGAAWIWVKGKPPILEGPLQVNQSFKDMYPDGVEEQWNDQVLRAKSTVMHGPIASSCRKVDNVATSFIYAVQRCIIKHFTLVQPVKRNSARMSLNRSFTPSSLKCDDEANSAFAPDT